MIQKIEQDIKFALVWKHHFIKAYFCYALTALFLQAVSKDKRGNRKTFLSISLFVHLHRPVFTGVIVKDIMQLIVKIEFFYLHIKKALDDCRGFVIRWLIFRFETRHYSKNELNSFKVQLIPTWLPLADSNCRHCG